MAETWDGFTRGGQGGRVGVQHVAHHLGHVLVDEDYVDIVSADERLQGVLYVGDWTVLVHHHEVRLPVLVELPYPPQQEADTRVLVSNDANQLPPGRAGSHPGSCRLSLKEG